MKKRTVLIKIVFILLIAAILPTLFFNSLIILSYNKLIGEYASLIKEAGIKIKKPFEKSLEGLKQEIISQIWLTFFLVAILVAFSFLMIFKSIIFPLRKLEKAFLKVAKGDLKVQLKKEREDEIGRLILSFNKMVQDLKKAKELLEEEKMSLEIKVKARTKALEEERLLLEEKVKERTKELRERIEELEKFHKLAVGRELKMIELKKELTALKKELKNKAKRSK
jgi:HAMP domain-containing protein